MAEGGRQKASGGQWQIAAAVVVALLSVAATLVVVFALGPTAGARIEIVPPPPTATQSPTATPAPLSVYVTGAVLKPGVVQCAAGSRVEDAIATAGGAAATANLLGINLAAPLSDGQHVHLPEQGEPVPTLPSGQKAAAPVNLNTAGLEELVTLPGIGEVTAAKIIDYRETNGPFAAIQEIMNVPGIGEGKFDGFKELITVGP